MSFWARLLHPSEPPLAALWSAIAAQARRPEWYLRCGVPDTLDGRFDVVALLTALVLLELEARGLRRETAWLTERFVDDMEGSLRQLGVGDLVVGKHVGRMVGALGGRLGAVRAALAAPKPATALEPVVVRNVWRAETAPPGVDPSALVARLLDVRRRLAGLPDGDLLAGRLGN